MDRKRDLGDYCGVQAKLILCGLPSPVHAVGDDDDDDNNINIHKGFRGVLVLLAFEHEFKWALARHNSPNETRETFYKINATWSLSIGYRADGHGIDE